VRRRLRGQPFVSHQSSPFVRAASLPPRACECRFKPAARGRREREEAQTEADVRLGVDDRTVQDEPTRVGQLDLKDDALALAHLAERFDVAAAQTQIIDARCVLPREPRPVRLKQQAHALLISPLVRHLKNLLAKLSAVNFLCVLCGSLSALRG
jgi:hypothetical protein